MDRFIQFAVAAADIALKDAGATRSHAGTHDMTGVYIGSGIGGFATIEREHETLLEAGAAQDQPLLHPGRHRQPGLGLGLHPHGRQGAQLRHLHRLHHAAPTRWATPSGSSSAATPT